MIRSFEGVLLSSEDAKMLAEFYRDVVGLEIKQEFEGEDGVMVYEMDTKNGSSLFINAHDKVKGKNKEPERLIINLEVDDIEKEAKRLKDQKVKLIADIYHIEEYGLIATFEDPDGNYFQFVQIRPTES